MFRQFVEALMEQRGASGAMIGTGLQATRVALCREN